MRRRIRSHLTYANVMATIAVFIALGGASYAAFKLPKNSVGTKQIKKSAVTTARIKNEAITAAKVKKGTLTGTQINASTLGIVPTANSANVANTAAVAKTTHTADVANTAHSLDQAENWHEVGAPGEPQFQNSWGNTTKKPGSPETVAFYKDHEGLVHLKGMATGGIAGAAIFHLPMGYRPASERYLKFVVGEIGGSTDVLVYGSGAVIRELGGSVAFLDGVIFRAES